MPGPGCFSDAELQAFLLGDLCQRVSEAVAAHLEACGQCAARAEPLDDLTDEVVCSLRQAHRSSPGGAAPTSVLGSAVPKRVAVAVQTRDSEPLPLKVAGYTVLGELGRGGMGVVYRARQAHPDRLVALKMILVGAHAGPERRARFLAEADAIARLQHPDIVQVYEVGVHDGLPFLSLEYLAGGSLAERTRGQPQPPRQAAELVEKLARAVHHAHQQGIVHRDLKPANILLTAQGQPKVSDFGLAKQEGPELTATGAVLGTPSYMAPEQAAGDNRAVGPAADVYALGAILYELLTGRPPCRGATTLETLEQVRSQEVVPPNQLQARTPPDLNTLCLKCLHKEPARRYATALELADDLQRFLDDKPVRVRPVGWVERLWRWSRRNPGWAGMLLTVAVLLLVILVGGSAGILQLNDALEQSGRNLGQAREAERATQEQLFDSLLAQARGNSLSRRPGQRFHSLEIVARAAELARRLELPPPRWLELRNTAIRALALPDLHLGRTWQGFPGTADRFDFDAELARYVQVDLDGKGEVRRVADNHLLYSFPRQPPYGEPPAGPYPQLSRDGRFLVMLHSDKVLRLWSLAEPDAKLLLQAENVIGAEFHPDSKQLALAHGDRIIRCYALDAGACRLLRALPDSPTKMSVSLAFHPTEPLLAVAHWNAREARVLNLRDGAVLQTLAVSRRPGDVAWHPHGHTLAVSETEGQSIHLYERTTFREVRTLRGAGPATMLAFHPTGGCLAAYTWHGVLQLFDPGTGKVLFQTSTRVQSLRPRFSRDGQRLAGETRDGRLGIWEVGVGAYRTLHLFGEQGPIPDAHMDVGPSRVGGGPLPHPPLVAIETASGVQLRDLETGQELGRLPLARLPQSHLRCPHFVSGEPGALLTADPSGLLRWPIQPSKEDPGTLRVGPPETLPELYGICASHSRGGQVLVAHVPAPGPLHSHGGVWVYHAGKSGPPLCLEKGELVRNSAVSPDGRWVAIARIGMGSIRVWDARTGQPVKELTDCNGYWPRFSPDGRWLAVLGDPGGLYAVETWERSLRFSGRAQFTPDSRLLAVETGAGVIRLIDIARNWDLAHLEDPNQQESRLYEFTPDGGRLVTLTFGQDGGVHVWDLRAIRRQLKAMDLDWDAPDYPPPPAGVPRPLQLKVVP